jgi:tetratricopeptide (TPR) repeat protein
MVSNHYQEANAPLDKPWKMMPGTVHPSRLIEPLSELRIHPMEIEGEQLLPFVPRADEKDEVIFGANLLDITPTILTLFGLPVGRDMDGKSLVTALTETPAVEYLESWDEVEGDSAMHPPNLRVDPVESQEAIQQLVDLGYIDEPDADKEQAIAQTVRELRYNLARSYSGANRHAEAIPILENLWEEYPEESRFGVHLFNSLLPGGRVAEARATLDKIMIRKQETAQKAAEELRQLAEELKEKPPEDCSDKERQRLRKLSAKAGINQHTLAFLQGCLLQAEGNYTAAIQQFEAAKDAQTHNLPSLYLRIGELYLAQRNWLQADCHFLQVLELDPVNAEAHLGLCQSHLKQGRNDDALKEAMAALGLIYYNPQAHFFCGVALYRCGQVLDAIKALETAIQQNPVFPAAHRYLSRIYTQKFADAGSANKHRQLAKESLARIKAFKAGESLMEETPATVADWYQSLSQQTEDKIPEIPLEETAVIVSGLPRSGTSMLMQMLAAGGIPVITDSTRQADESNPLGYYEFEKAKQVGTDNSWIPEAKGKAVKIVAQLLPKLPLGQPYRIIFMQRPLSEVIASQEKMLQRLKKKGSKLSRQKLAETFNRQLGSVQNLLNNYQNIDVLYLNYHDVIANPVTAAARINRFLGNNFDEEKMAAAVVPDLWHQRAIEPK